MSLLASPSAQGINWQVARILVTISLRDQVSDGIAAGPKEPSSSTHEIRRPPCPIKQNHRDFGLIGIESNGWFDEEIV